MFIVYEVVNLMNANLKLNRKVFGGIMAKQAQILDIDPYNELTFKGNDYEEGRTAAKL